MLSDFKVCGGPAYNEIVVRYNIPVHTITGSASQASESLSAFTPFLYSWHGMGLGLKLESGLRDVYGKQFKKTKFKKTKKNERMSRKPGRACAAIVSRVLGFIYCTNPVGLLNAYWYLLAMRTRLKSTVIQVYFEGEEFLRLLGINFLCNNATTVVSYYAERSLL